MGCQPSRLSSGDSPPSVQSIEHGTVSVDELRRSLATGDMIFISGNTLLSRLIRLGTWFHYSHVALVDVAANAQSGENEVFLLESVRHDDGVIDILTGQVRPGTRLAELGARLEPLLRSERYADVCVVKLHADSLQAHERLVSHLRDFERTVCRRPYETHVLDMMRAQYPTLLGSNSHDDTSSYFCSELVADALRYMEVLPRSLIAARLTPAMLAYAAATFHNRWGLARAYYAPEIHCYSVVAQRKGAPLATAPAYPIAVPYRAVGAPLALDAAAVAERQLQQQQWNHADWLSLMVQQQQQQQQHSTNTNAGATLPLDCPSVTFAYHQQSPWQWQQ